jgi:hypothetical protein
LFVLAVAETIDPSSDLFPRLNFCCDAITASNSIPTRITPHWLGRVFGVVVTGIAATANAGRCDWIGAFEDGDHFGLVAWWP